MRKKTCTYKIVFKISGIILILFVITIISYKYLGLEFLKRATWDYIYTQGYSDNDIESVRVNHSYIGGLLGYGQWVSEVIFKDEPNIYYDCVIRRKLPLRVTGFRVSGYRGDIPDDYMYKHETCE